MTQEGPVSRIHMEKYTSWSGSKLGRGRILPNVIAEQFRHNLGNKWVKSLIVIAWLFTVFLPLLRASFGELILLQDPNDSPFTDHNDELEIINEVSDEVLPLHQTIPKNGTAKYNLTVVNYGNVFCDVRVFLGHIDGEWNAVLMEIGDESPVWELVRGLNPGESFSFTLAVWPHEGTPTQSGEVHVGGEFNPVFDEYSKESQFDRCFFAGEQGLTKWVTTRTYIGTNGRNEIDMTMNVENPAFDIQHGDDATFRFSVVNNGNRSDTYIIKLNGLSEDWSFAIDADGMSETGGSNVTFTGTALRILLGPGESYEFDLIYDPPKYPMDTVFLALSATSASDESQRGSILHMIRIDGIPKKDMTEEIFTDPAGGLYGNPIFILFSVFLAAVVGSKAISNDLAEKSFTLYFSRPIKKMDYIAIKFGAVGATMCMLTLVPILITYGGLILLSNVDVEFMIDHLWVWGAIVLYSLLITLVLTSIAIAFSSLTARKFYAAFGLVIVYFLSAIISVIIMEDFKEERGGVVSLHISLTNVGSKIFRVPDSAFNYDWEYNLYALLIITIASFIVVSLKIWKTELSE